MENYIVSARKYRPATFDSVVGQKSLTETLRNAIRQNHLAHAYLFCGPRGVGKTTCARIFAKTINCLHPAEGNNACNECESCRAFNEQRSFNIHELDAASNNSVDDIRSLIEQVRIPPQIGKYSVYIIDEVHMLSSGAFNALLKTLEEPPSYAIFILATTEKNKVLPTILSRCQVYDFSRITVADTIAHLQYVAAQEGIIASEEALNVVAQKADGGMRDALSIFDQLVAFSGNTVTYERAIEVLNVLDTDYYFRIVDYALAGNVTETLLLLDEVLRRGFDAGNFVTGLASHLRDVLVSKDERTIQLIETSDAIRRHYAEQAARCAAPWLFRALDVMNTCDIQYRTAKNKRLTVELALIRLTQLNAVAAAPAAPAASAAPAPAVATATKTAPQATAPKAQPAAQPARATQPQVQPTRTTAAPGMPGIPSMPNMPSIPTIPTMPGAGAPVNTSVAGGAGATTQAVPNPTATTTAPAQGGQNSPFTEDQFNSAWIGLKHSFQEESRLLNMINAYRPVLHSPELCVLTVDNALQKKEFAKYGRQVMDQMRTVLHNDMLRMEVRVADYQRERRAYTAEEKYRVLVEVNPQLKQLKESLSLLLE